MASANGSNAQLLKTVETKNMTATQKKEAAFQQLITRGLRLLLK
ncbi:hypothetical protein Ga0466249_001704 [Sporomusaceae bacterium BoRhaA]|nr:hypothetical protein [Pelorhabdus rhamnosifermentans]MBU2700612.1 hypothetical protein [Pelorhabdus rhamnosifermentans]